MRLSHGAPPVLGREDRPPAGARGFRENFPTEGLLESEVVVGDVCRVGVPGRGAVVQVSQPRTLCYKLAARPGVKELAAWFAEAGITGFYLRLVDPGEVRPGDPLALFGRPAHEVTVLETNRVMYRDRHDEAGLERVLAVPECPARGWRPSRSGSPRSPEGRSGRGRDGEERNASGSLRGGRAARSPLARDGFLRRVLESWRRVAAGRDEGKPWGNIRQAQPPPDDVKGGVHALSCGMFTSRPSRLRA